jgi:hypothetical protein
VISHRRKYIEKVKRDKRTVLDKIVEAIDADNAREAQEEAEAKAQS